MKKPKIHFMGIAGSGMSAAAMIAHSQGYQVSGCDSQKSSPYLGQIKDAGILSFVGHDAKHLKGIDILAVSPALFFLEKKPAEFEEFEKRMTWQAFMGEYLQKGKRVISVSGTHGKSTTSAMLGLIYERLKTDPTVMVGANIYEWNSNYRIGNSNLFLHEADEFYANFLHYRPDVIILNNVEFDHPDFFTSENHVLETFGKFIENLKGEKTLIINQDSEGILKLFAKIGKGKLQKINIIGYSLSQNPIIQTKDSFRADILDRNSSGTGFRVTNEKRKFDEVFKLTITGDYNIYNSLGIIALAAYDNQDMSIVKKSIKEFNGVGRRVELLGEKDGVVVYDDYAHHPTEIKASLSGLRQKYPDKKIMCIVEPHMFSRTKILLDHYTHVFDDADKVLIAPIFKSRDTHDHGVSNESIVDIADHPDITACSSFAKIIEVVGEIDKRDMVIVVVGAGKSYQLARDILESLQ